MAKSSVTPINDWTKNVINQRHGTNWSAYHSDCVPFLMGMPDNSVGHSVYSPPFAQLFIYSESAADMGNCNDESQFLEQYAHTVRELYRVTKPGRITAVHCTDIPRNKGTHGYCGLYDFPADIRKLHEDAGWTYHSRITVWKDPVVEMQRTKALGLLFKQIQKDSTRSRQGLPDYVLVFRKTPKDEKDADCVTKDARQFPVDLWQKWASPVWMDVNQTNVLNVRMARNPKDEKHLCPLQLDLIERSILLWSNPGDVIFSPFMGVGSEGYAALKNKRKFIGTELHPNYYSQACKYLAEAEAESGSLLDMMAAQ